MLNQNRLFSRLAKYDRAVSEEKIKFAYKFAKSNHSGQFRETGEDYFTHPLAVSEILLEMKLDSSTIITALLHDVVEDSKVTLDDIDKSFGKEIRKLVDGVTKLSKIELKTGLAQAENFRKLLISSSDDVRVLIVKLADRLHNIRTIDGIKDENKKQKICKETLEIYAPLAERLGIVSFQNELEDRCFKVINPETRESISRRLELIYSEDSSNIPYIKKELQTILAKNNVRSEISGRKKSCYSIWKKMQLKKVGMDDLSDIMAFRIIVYNVNDCYKCLSLLHQNYTAIMGRFKDYISAPKRNRYQSLHTALIGPKKRKIELQIRTDEMNEFAINGIAAHWMYKNRTKYKEGIKYKWVRELLQIIEDSSSPEEFLEHTKLEMYNDQVFCFTPKGNLINLPRGASAIDFAYAVHSEVGNLAVGAKINNKVRQLSSVLKNGDQVEILTSTRGFPEPIWLENCVTGKSKSSIRRFVRKREIEEFNQLGISLLKKEFRQQNKKLNVKSLRKAIDEYGLIDVDELLVEIGKGNIITKDIYSVLYPSKNKSLSVKKQKFDKNNKNKDMKIKGVVPGMSIHYAHCCNPLPGERIVGIVTTGKGITVHAIDCFSLEKFHDVPERWLEISWEREDYISHKGKLSTVLSNEPGSLADVTRIISSIKGNISNIQVIKRDLNFYKFFIDLEVKNISHLNEIIAALRLSPFVESVERERI
ncbi:MAG: bifunctional (p)ppGpp synthetase/guanosine-3',5'-bis(diphosphate) 3'-pyrophosphohydrolase [SAR116 cluster bacterium]|nr:bifunctional (p)ppGpp synthetase/guanosine-3',5'-bis(diphosphate) 3'-pyrophosphohydrolase [SAR116 cluster bacterium]|tara:strand:+ start:300 stop:2417 length:2118 start_codon:yes stop_codon:yes gene_type:complete